MHIESIPEVAGEVVHTVTVIQDLTELRRKEQIQRFLAEASSLLSSSLDYNSTLQNVAQMAVKNFADWCVVDVVEDENRLHMIAVAHTDPERVFLAHELRRKFPPQKHAKTGVFNVIRSGEPEFYPQITNELLQKTIADPELRSLLRELGLKSAILLPLKARDRTFGALTLVWSDPGGAYSQLDIDVAKELASRAAYAIDNSRLYKESQRLNAELEARVNQRTSQLQGLISKLRSEITERKKAEEALQKNETLLRNLFNSAPDATLLVDEYGEIVEANYQAENLFGYSRIELLQKNIEMLVPASRRRSHAELLKSYFRNPYYRPMGANLDLSARRKDGSQFPADIMLSPLQTDRGIQVLTTIRDLTERRQMEAELAEVQQRLIDNTEAERLHLAQELHDGPIQELYGITFQLAALRDNPIPDELKQELGQINETMQQVIRILRATSGDLRPPTLAPFGLQKAIQAHLEKIAETHPDLIVHHDLAADGQELPERIRLALFRIYQHAVSNVLRHAHARNMYVRFELNPNDVMLEIQDDGSGFELPSRWVELARGGHMGLIGTAERANAIGGKLSIRSTPEKGTRIQVRVPRDQDQTPRMYSATINSIGNLEV